MEEFSEKQVNGAAVILDENSKLVVAPLHEPKSGRAIKRPDSQRPRERAGDWQL